MNAPAHYLIKLDATYHSALRFVTNLKALTHHCTLYARASLPSLTVRRLSHWYMFIYKAMLGKLPPYICSLISQSYCLRSQDVFLLHVPCARTILGTKTCICAAPLAWNTLQNILKIKMLVPLHHLKAQLDEMLFDTPGTCLCEYVCKLYPCHYVVCVLFVFCYMCNQCAAGLPCKTDR